MRSRKIRNSCEVNPSVSPPRVASHCAASRTRSAKVREADGVAARVRRSNTRMRATSSSVAKGFVKVIIRPGLETTNAIGNAVQGGKQQDRRFDSVTQ